MDAISYLPIILEATEFAFWGELGDRLEHAYDRTKEISTRLASEELDQTSKFSSQALAFLKRDREALVSSINVQAAKANFLAVKNLVEQLRIHIKNIDDLETVEAQYGLLVPQHVKHGIEHEAKQIVEKSKRLQELLFSVTSVQLDEVASTEGPSKRTHLTKLHRMLSRHFNEGELRTLCFDLGIDYDDLSGEGKANKARELVSFLSRRNRVSELLEIGKELRPDIPWTRK